MTKKICRKFTLCRIVDKTSGAFIREKVYFYSKYQFSNYQPNRPELHYFMMGLCAGLGKDYMYDDFNNSLDANLPVVDIAEI